MCVHHGTAWRATSGRWASRRTADGRTGGHFGGRLTGRGGYDPTRGLVALDGRDRVLGVMGLRDAQGGFWRQDGGWRDWLYRPAPPTGDLVIDEL